MTLVVAAGPSSRSAKPTMSCKVLPVMVASVPCCNDTPSFQPAIRLLLMTQAGNAGAGLRLQRKGVRDAGALQHRVGDGDVVGADVDRIDAAEGRRSAGDP